MIVLDVLKIPIFIGYVIAGVFAAIGYFGYYFAVRCYGAVRDEVYEWRHR